METSRYNPATLFIGFILLLSCPFSSSAADLKLPATSTISSVTVFLNQAQVSRTASVSLKPGVTSLVFDHRSPYINISSIQVKAGSDLNIISVTTRNNFLKTEHKPDEILFLEDSLEKTTDMLAHVRIKKEALQVEKEIMQSNKQLGGANAGLHADDIEEVLSLYHKRTEEIGEELLKLGRSEKKLLAILAKLKKQLDEFTTNNLTPLEIIITVQTDKELTETPLEYSYFVANAHWVPFYDVRVKDAKSPLQLVSKANITQQTGEDWGEVKLKLSTSNPNESGLVPELQTCFIGFDHPVELKHAAVGAPNAAMAEDMAYGKGTAEVKQNPLNIEFTINSTYSIPSDNNPHQVDLSMTNYAAAYAYHTVPKLDQSVYAVARIPAIELANQIAGEANVYYDGAFVGKTWIEGSSNDTLLITLGKDPRFQVERMLLKDFSGKSFTGSTRKEVFTWEISLRNSRKESFEVITEDQIPVSTDKEIEVKLLDAGNAVVDLNTGKVTWKVKLEGESTTRLKLSFEVRYPKDKSVTPF